MNIIPGVGKRIVLGALLILGFFNCQRKDEVFTSDPNARLSFSVTALKYDTVYSDLTYPSRKIKVYNPNSEALSINEVVLDGGVASFYTILVNGQKGPIVNDLELLGGDSMLVYVNLFFNAQNNSSPYTLQDAIRFRFNGQEQTILLNAVGEDALLVESGDLPCATVWDDQKTVILKGQATVPSGCTLTVQKGTKVLASSGTSIDVKGTLVIAGDKDNPVIMTSTASGKAPGQWEGIRFYEGSLGNSISWLHLSNATTGLRFASTTASSLVDLSIDHTALYDFTDHVLDLSYCTLQASNCLFMASANALTVFSNDGSYTFKHCTWAGYSYDYYREGPCIKTNIGALSLNINDAIVWGDKTNELEIDPTTTANIDTTVLKTNATIAGQGQLVNQDPQFVSPVNRDYTLRSSSPAIDKGVTSSVTDDLKGKSRDTTPDLGCFEYIP